MSMADQKKEKKRKPETNFFFFGKIYNDNCVCKSLCLCLAFPSLQKDE